MSDFLSMFDYGGKTARILGKNRINTYKDIYLHIDKEQGKSLQYNGDYLGNNELAEKIYNEKYFIKDLDNKLIEKKPEDVFKRLASFIATLEPSKAKQYKWAEKFYNELYNNVSITIDEYKNKCKIHIIQLSNSSISYKL